MFTKRLDLLINSYMKQGYFPGIVGQVSLQGETVYKQAFGKADIPTNQKMTTESVFDIASLTKIVMTVVILRIISEKRISLATTLSESLPAIDESRVLNKYLSQITVEQLLTHSSGLKHWYPFYSQRYKGNFYQIITKILLETQNNNKVTYSDINFMLLGEIIKYQLEMPLTEVVKRYIVEPLELASLTYIPEKSGKIVATEYGNQVEQQMCEELELEFSAWRATNQPIRGEVNDGNAYYFFSGIAAHAGLFSNIDDLIKIGEVFTTGGKWKGKQFVDEKLIYLSMRSHQGGRGLGWEISDLFPGGVGHTGFTGTSLWIIPDKRMVVAMLTNRLHMQAPKNINPFRRGIHEEIKNILN